MSGARGGGGSGALAGRTAAVASVLDQGAAGLTNILVLVLAARLSTVAGFAEFSMVYLVFTVALGLFMAYVGQALVLVRGDAGAAAAACRSALAFTAAGACATGAALAAAGAALPPGGRALVALGAVLPVVLLQDAARYCFSLLGRPHHALAADGLRLASTVAVLAAQPAGASPGRLVLAWGLAALPGLAVAALLLRRPLAGARTELRRYLRRGHLGRRFAVEFAVGNGSGQVAVLCLGLLGSPLAVGALRGASALFGPLNVFFGAANGFGPPLLNRLGGGRSVVRVTLLLGCALAAAGAAWGGVWWLLPDGWGRRVLGGTWPAVAALLPASAAQYTLMGLGVSALLTLRVLSPRETLPVQVVFSLLSVALLYAGFAAGGAVGAAWGLAAGSGAKALAAWARVARVRRRADAPGAAAVAGP
ncbi:hypothetical protein [Streptomyces roseolilacinus]|uniref:O-antigen/teichoic acid export membrane protein n=1 Tax=Streptomyces roseolilacinus TaxID=66904 RepID=A0A918B0T3_9ACTN|nr:hypothetical protein [Streptomyces roseolilacinus]GGQ03067.1 hypothetical protein GCM10010249_21650 [Streptomyces roseolilacinus]